MTRQVTFRTTDIDAASAVYNETSEIPEMVKVGDLVEARFYGEGATDAARKFRNNNPLQNFLTAKKMIYRLFQKGFTRGQR